MKRLTLIAALVGLGLLEIASAQTAPQEQASNLAVPPVKAADPSSVMAIVFCNKISGLAVIDTEGTIHPITLEGLKSADVIKIMQSVPADRVKSANMGCPGNPSKDTTVL